MSILTIEWGTLHSSPLASAEPLETELMPTSAYLTAYTPLAAWGPVATSAENVAAFMTVTWQPRRGTTDLPFDATDMTIPSAPAEEPTGGEETSTGGGETGITTTPTEAAGTGTDATVSTPGTGSATVKPPAAHLATAAKIAATGFFAKGLEVKLNLPEAARVEAFLVYRERRRVKGKEKVVDVRVSKPTKVRKGAGKDTITIHPDAAGKRLLKGMDAAVKLRLEVKVAFAGGVKRRLTRTITLAPSRDS